MRSLGLKDLRNLLLADDESDRDHFDSRGNVISSPVCSVYVQVL